MALTPGTRLGLYEIVAPLGAGGMGEVYRARDTKLNRDVAIKVLPEEFAADADRLARFSREAQVLASLNHPNIAAIYGLESSSVQGPGSSVQALVMELVEGQDLSVLIAVGAPGLQPGGIPLAEAIAIAKQIVDALEAAHESGIVHRDLKPANVKVRADGTVKVLDFGLAKAMDPAGVSGVNPSNSPTLTARATQMGMVIGTAAYMAPEQARGRAVDRRADIWAFGVVLYEMLAGRRAFEGDDISITLANVLKEDVRWDALPADVPASLVRLMRRCLEKDPKRRLGWIGEARFTLDDPHASEPASAGARAPMPLIPLWRRALPWAVAALAILVAGLVSARHFQETTAIPVTTRFQVAWPLSASGATGSAQFFQLSPDGRHLAIVSDGSLWVRSLESLESTRLDRTQGATYPFWSPDGASIGFFASGQLKTIPRAGGPVQNICEAPDGRGATWSPRGTIVFADRAGTQGLSQVAEQGGTPISLTKVVTSEMSEVHRYPQFLPDGEHFLFLRLTGATDVAGVYVGSLDGREPVRVLDGGQSAIFALSFSSAASGHLLFRRQNSLMAQAFDAQTLRTSGPVLAVAADVSEAGNTGYGAFSAAADGVLAHTSNAGLVRERELVWVDRSGTRQGAVTPSLNIGDFALSRDDRRIAIGVRSADQAIESDIWLQTVGGGLPSRFTFGPRPGWKFPLWSPAGDKLAYATIDKPGEPGYEIRLKSANRTGAEELLLRVEDIAWLWDWSPNGKFIVFSDRGDLKLLPLDGDHSPTVFAKTPGQDQYGQFSPDGKWMAYSSGPRGQTEVYVQPFPATGPLWQISTDGGDMPRWGPNGKELFYRAGDGRLMAVAVSENAGVFEPGPRTALFVVPGSGNSENYTYQPSADGQRFLISAPLAGASPPITVVLNWQAGLKK